MPARFRIESLTFSNGDEVALPTDGVLVLVGPNNAGKSATLREIVSLLTQLPGPGGPPELVLRDLRLSREGSPDELVAWLEHHAYSLRRPEGRVFRRSGGGAEGAESELLRQWQLGLVGHGQWGRFSPPRAHVPALAQFFVFHASADQRLGLLNGSGPHNPVTDAPSNPMQALFADPELEARLSAICEEAFGTQLHLSRLMGANLDLYVGQPQSQPSIVPTTGYVEELQRMPLLNAQGDGMRSFMGLMLALSAGQYQLLLIDEPEAFLHPPQARQLGRRIATESPDTQVVVATHDVNILRGLLEAGSHTVAVIRLTRRDNENVPALLSSDDVAELWQDPILHYSNAFDGLFHRGAVICEADTDARFYAAVLDAISREQGRQSHDLLFTEAGGKDRLHVLVRALRAVEVPVAVIADLDLLREQQGVVRVVEALGGTWSATDESDHTQLLSGVHSLGSAPSRLVVQEEITGILTSAESSGRLTRDDVDAIRGSLRLNDGWQIVKRGGLMVLPSGQAYEAGGRLLARLASLGLFLVPAGELERWFPEIGGHGTKWVADSLARGLHNQPATPVRAFVESVVAMFDVPTLSEVALAATRPS